MHGLSPRGLFLIDALGALTSAILLGLILPYFKEFIGMPKHILWVLAIVALLFFFCSISCYLKLPVNLKYYMRGIAIANFLYCILTTSLLIFFWLEVTLLGRVYFIGELILIMGLVLLESRMSSKNF